MEGVYLYPLRHIIVPKGDIYHALKSTDEGYMGFGEAYFSQIESGEIKGWKRHNRFVLNLIVPVGEIKFVIYDDRGDSSTRGEFFEIILSPKANYQRLTIAPGLWMAFAGMGRETSILMDIIPKPHDPTESDRQELAVLHYNFFNV